MTRFMSDPAPIAQGNLCGVLIFRPPSAAKRRVRKVRRLLPLSLPRLFFALAFDKAARAT
jgi:hypothetical protein